MNVEGRLITTLLSILLLLGAAGAGAVEEPATTTGPANPAAAEKTPDGPTEAEIRRLIEQLGDDEFVIRERAQDKLEQFGTTVIDARGTTVFDLLLEFQDHEDAEIASRAYYLVRAIPVQWSRPGDSETLRECLSGYSETEPEDREAILEAIAASDAADWPAGLGRIVRFEPSERLSKQAALMLIERQLQPDAFDDRSELARQIDRELRASPRPAADWLRLYLQAAEKSDVLVKRWEGTCDREQMVLTDRPDRSSREIKWGMLFWFVEALHRDKQPEKAEKAMERLAWTIDSEEDIEKETDPARKALRQAQLERDINQLLRRGLTRDIWGLIPYLERRAPDLFANNGEFLYYLAASYARQGRTEQAERLAQKAFETLENPPNQEDEWLTMVHYARGIRLNYYGLSAWAEREYLAAIKLVPVGSAIGIRARLSLAAMYDEDQDYLKAAEVLKPLVEQLEKDTDLERILRGDMEREPKEIRAAMHYYYAEHHGRQGKTAEQTKQLDEAIRVDPSNIDALIALYNLDRENPQRREKMLVILHKAIAKYKNEIEILEKQYEAVPASEELRQTLSSSYNTYAWLVACTEGDLRDALRCSQESLKLNPDSYAILDTLARCYCALGDYETALKHEQRAVALAPHSPALQRQLEMIRAALEEKQSGTP